MCIILQKREDAGKHKTGSLVTIFTSKVLLRRLINSAFCWYVQNVKSLPYSSYVIVKIIYNNNNNNKIVIIIITFMSIMLFTPLHCSPLKSFGRIYIRVKVIIDE